jgi:hypothetical protein
MHIITVLLLSMAQLESTDVRLPDCSTIKIAVEMDSINDESIRIELRVTGGNEPYFYFFFDEKNNPLSWDFDKNYLQTQREKFPAYGKVRDANGCVKRVDFKHEAK